MTRPPSQAELEALAERALAQLDGEGRVTAWWERRAESTPGSLRGSEDVRVELAVGQAKVETTQVDDEGLRVAAAAAARLGGDRARELPEPAVGRPHEAYDPSAGSLAALAEAASTASPAASAEVAATGARAGWADVATAGRIAWWTSAAGKIAIASTRGVRAYEQRSFAGVRLFGLGSGRRRGALTAAASGLAGIDFAGLVAELDALTGTGEPVDVAPGEHPVVLAPWAVAGVLERLSFQLHELVERRGTRVVAPCINLSDSPRFPGTLARSYDVEGMPKQPVPLIQDGVAHRGVDRATGHAPSLGERPRPEHLVLVGGGAADVAELAAGLGDGLLIGALEPDGYVPGARVIAGGELGPPAKDFRVELDPLEVLAATDALTSRQRLVPSADWRSVRSIGAMVVPALRARAGIRVVRS